MRIFQIIIGIMCIAAIFSIAFAESELDELFSNLEESEETEEIEESEAQTDSPIIKSCRGPDLKEGVCSHLEDCYEMLNSLVTPLSETTKNFIKASKNICQAHDSSGICCPISTSHDVTTDNVLLPSNSCGLVHIERSFPKIVGGRNSEIGAWPWLAQLLIRNSTVSVYVCTGSLITARRVVTAAHCIMSDLSFVRLGEYDMSKETETKHVDINITKWLVHENFQKADGLNDLAILFLEKKVQFTDLIAPICLPVSSKLRAKSYVGSKPFVAGWGYTSEEGKQSDILQELQTTVLENEVCYEAFKSIISSVLFDSSVLCVGDLKGGKDTCQGDSGGPLMMPEVIEGQLRFYLIGVVSYGHGCARKDMAGVFSKIPYHLDWILKRIN